LEKGAYPLYRECRRFSTAQSLLEPAVFGGRWKMKTSLWNKLLRVLAEGYRRLFAAGSKKNQDVCDLKFSSRHRRRMMLSQFRSETREK
jgi:hypothetical protein